MGVITPSATEFADQLARTLPPGRWALRAGTIVYQILLAAGDEMARVAQRVADLLEESDPRTTVELLPEWEADLALESTGTDAERQARIVAKLTEQNGARPADFQTALAPLFGLEGNDVEIIERDRAFAVLVSDDSAIFVWFAYRDPTLPGTYSITDAQVQIDSQKPAHTQGFAIESISFRCDDIYSLCDRDILESGPHDFLSSELSIPVAYLWPGRRTDTAGLQTLIASGLATDNNIVDGFVPGNRITERSFDLPLGANAWTAPSATAGSLASGATLFLYAFRISATPPANRCMFEKATPSAGLQVVMNSSGAILCNLEAGPTVQINLGGGHDDGEWHVMGIVVDLVDGEFLAGSDVKASVSVAPPAGSVDSGTALAIGAGLADGVAQEVALMVIAVGSDVQALLPATLDAVIAAVHAAVFS